MSKQVQLRRGTTTQHATFTGAQGEVTYDTDRNCLVVHDGVTPGGRPLAGFVMLNPAPLSLQTLSGMLKISGGDAFDYSLQTDFGIFCGGKIVVNGEVFAQYLRLLSDTLTYAPTVNLDFGLAGFVTLSLTGDVTFTSSNLGGGCVKTVRVLGDTVLRNLAFPAAWTFVGAKPTNIAANKTGLLELTAFSNADSGVLARWSVQQ